MPFLRPTLTTLRNTARQYIVSVKPGAKVLLNYSNLGVLADLVSNAASDLYGYVDWIAHQAVPWTATGEFLAGWAALRGITRVPASAATGSITFSGTIGASLPVGAMIRRTDGVTYQTTSAAVVGPSGSVTVSVLCLVVGLTGNYPAGLSMSLVNGADGIMSAGTSGLISGGADQEIDDSLRSRMLARYRQVPQSGASYDFSSWALAVPGVTRAWVYAGLMGAGSVTVWTMFDNANAATGGFPAGGAGVAAAEYRGQAATGDLLTVANVIYPLRPVTAVVYANAPTAFPVNFTITNLVGSTAAMRTAVQAAINAVFLSNADVLGGTIYLSQLDNAILSVPGVTTFTLTAPSANITAPLGSLPVLGTLTFA